MNEKQTGYDWVFGLQWLVAGTLGMILFGMTAFFSIWTIGDIFDEIFGETAAWLAAGAMFGMLFALGASLGPGLLLQARGVDAKQWIGFSTAAGAIGAALGMGLFMTFFDAEAASDRVAGLVMGLSVGLPVGIGQWLALRRAAVAATYWPLITTAAFLLAFEIGLPLGGEDTGWLAITMIGLIFGAVSALGITWILGRQRTVLAV